VRRPFLQDQIPHAGPLPAQAGRGSRSGVKMRPLRMGESWSGRALWSLAGAAIWVALEMVRGRAVQRFPWNPLGASQYQLSRSFQIASVTGVLWRFVSGRVVFACRCFPPGALFSAVPPLRMAWQGEIILPLFSRGAVVFGFARINEQNPSGATLRIYARSTQHPQTLIWNSSGDDQRFQQLLQLSHSIGFIPGLTNHEPLLGAPASRRPAGSQNQELAGETPALQEPCKIGRGNRKPTC